MRKCLCLSLHLLLILICIVGFGAGKEVILANTVIEVTQEEIGKKGVFQGIQDALDIAKEKATEENCYLIKVEAGEYELDKALVIYGNTTLDLTDVKLKRIYKTNIIRVGKSELGSSRVGVLGYYYKNISIIGGVLDGGNLGATMVKVGHAQNFSIQGTTFQNVYNAHEMEVAGVDGFYLNECTFNNQKLDRSASALAYEAIQLDILYSKHIYGYRSEVLANTNIKITNCSFNDVPRAIGSHTAIMNVPVDGIEISGCTFTNINSVAIQGLNWKNCIIQKNEISKAVRGIAIYYARNNGQGCYMATPVIQEGGTYSNVSVEYEPSMISNIQILNNSIILNSKLDSLANYAKSGIYVGGYNVTEQSSFSDGSGNIPLGNYFIEDVTIAGNEIHTMEYGVYLKNIHNAKVSKNQIQQNVFNYELDYERGNGVTVVDHSENIQIDNNQIIDMDQNGIYVKESMVSKLEKNRISKCDGRGIWLYKNSKCENNIYKNTLQKCKLGGIKISTKSEAKNIYQNELSEIEGDSAILINAKSNTDSIYENKITVAGASWDREAISAIEVYSKSGCKSIYKNVMKTDSSKKKHVLDYGILVWEHASVTGKIASNRIYKTARSGIYFRKSTISSDIKNNHISNIKNNAICFDVSSVAGNDIYKNAILNVGKNGIAVETNSVVKGIIKSNSMEHVQNGICFKDYDDRATANAIVGNRIKYAKGNAILISSLRNSLKIEGNKMSGIKQSCIKIAPNSRIHEINITNNSISGNKDNNGINVVRGNVKITGNKISKVKTGIFASKRTKGTIGKNSYRDISAQRVYVAKEKGFYETTQRAVKVTELLNEDDVIKYRWKKMDKASAYMIDYSTDRNFVSDVTTIIVGSSYKGKSFRNLEAGKRYYFRIRTYKKCNGNLYVYGAYSPVKSYQVQ